MCKNSKQLNSSAWLRVNKTDHVRLYKRNTDGGGKMVCFKEGASLVVHVVAAAVCVAPSLGCSLHLRV